MLRNEIIKYLNALNEKLQQQNIKGEICLYGGAVMCLVYDARPSTKDVDAIFKPAKNIRKAAKEIAKEYELVDDWLNDGVKGFLVDHSRKVFRKYSACLCMSQFFKMLLNFLSRGYTQTSLMGTLILPDGPSFPRPLVCPHNCQLAAL